MLPPTPIDYDIGLGSNYFNIEVLSHSILPLAFRPHSCCFFTQYAKYLGILFFPTQATILNFHRYRCCTDFFKA